MSTDKDAGEDWLSAPVGTKAGGPAPQSDDSTSAAKSDSASSEPPSAAEQAADGSRYKSSFTNSLAKSTSSSLYPSGMQPAVTGESPALSMDPGPGPATSVGLGSSSTTTLRAASSRRAAARGPRRAKLQLRRIDPWSTLKVSLVLSVVFFFVWMVALAVLYYVLSTMGVFESIDNLFAEFDDSAGQIVTLRLVLVGGALVGAINIVLFTALSTIGAFIYNLCADLAGGLEITLSERR